MSEAKRARVFRFFFFRENLTFNEERRRERFPKKKRRENKQENEQKILRGAFGKAYGTDMICIQLMKIFFAHAEKREDCDPFFVLSSPKKSIVPRVAKLRERKKMMPIVQKKGA